MAESFSFFDPSSWPALAPYYLSQNILSGLSLITVNETNSPAPDAERRIVSEVSYGRQIGKLLDAVVELIPETEKNETRLRRCAGAAKTGRGRQGGCEAGTPEAACRRSRRAEKAGPQGVRGPAGRRYALTARTSPSGAPRCNRSGKGRPSGTKSIATEFMQ
ncbi:MAG: hypothetical protein WDN06_16380 [Asticcacaulis sp.]